ncbi:MAG TPA: YfiR family protein [Terriglobales bacterium]|nr:YfiR family protein [Terriglobales bacterium]
MASRRTLAIMGLLIAASNLWAQNPKPTEYQVKAAYLYNFGRFVEWPANAAGKGELFNVCVFGKDPFGPVLDHALAGETIGGKSVVARRISLPQESGNCQILFLSSAEEGLLNKIIEAANKEAVLTVSDMPQFSERGGMVQFVVENNRIRFEVNLTAAQNAGLTLRSELLRVATVVKKDPGN